ncbi:hypothetical protein DHB64_12890 [Antarcticibacterium sp. W02-3]|nr:hypothetical protein [Antarcticibacterium sp. W02-3]
MDKTERHLLLESRTHNKCNHLAVAKPLLPNKKTCGTKPNPERANLNCYFIESDLEDCFVFQLVDYFYKKSVREKNSLYPVTALQNSRVLHNTNHSQT